MFKKTKVKSATKISQELRGTTNNLHESPSLGRKNKLVTELGKFDLLRVCGVGIVVTVMAVGVTEMFSEESQNGDWVDCAQGFRLQLIKLATVTDVSHGAVRGPVIVEGISSSCYTQARCRSDGSPYRAVITLMYDYYLPRIAARKQKSHFSKTSVNTEDNASKTGSKDARLTSNLPKDAAVHFGNFYGVHESTSKPRPGKIEGSSNHGSEPTRTTPRLEFTRQMVHKLERTAGTEEYARQVSALLEETVEPAHFRLHSLPTENSIPEGGRQNPSGYPLWYKEPYKTPLVFLVT
ncbi:uncharacterized protein LOC143361702 [Halictus rubicundus]|uniref:uncharacterized protein LOC143361702 n=1 Tax=Halictus rubicundus TaxID=77578 RepID=UPI004036FF4B